MLSAIRFNLDQSKILSSGNGLNTFIFLSVNAFNLDKSKVLGQVKSNFNYIVQTIIIGKMSNAETLSASSET